MAGEAARRAENQNPRWASYPTLFAASSLFLPAKTVVAVSSAWCIVSLCCVSIWVSACLKSRAKSKSFNLKPATGCFLFAWSERGSCHPRTGKTNDCRAFPPSDLVKPPQIWVTKGFSEEPTCANLSLKYFMPASPMPVDTSESPSPLPAGMDCMAPTNVVLYSCSLIKRCGIPTFFQLTSELFSSDQCLLVNHSSASRAEQRLLTKVCLALVLSLCVLVSLSAECLVAQNPVYFFIYF